MTTPHVVPLVVLECVMVESTIEGRFVRAPVLQIDGKDRPDITRLCTWLQSGWQTTCRSLWEGLNLNGELIVTLWVGPPSDMGNDFVVGIPLQRWRTVLEAAAASGFVGLCPEPLRYGRNNVLVGPWFWLRPPMEALTQMLEATAPGVAAEE